MAAPEAAAGIWREEEKDFIAKGTIPLMAVIQPNKDKVRPVMDFRELNEYLDSHTAAADVCSEKIREWRRFGRNVSLLDLKDAYLQVHRRVTAVSSGWDDEVTDPELCAMVIEMVERVNTSDPARGRWDVSGDGGGVVWVDASSLAIGAVLEINDCVVEDACWLRKSSDTHINLAELDAVIRGLNLALSWNLKNVTIMTDSRTVYHWLSDVLSGRARVKTKAASEMLIRRRLETVKKLGEEYAMQLCVKFVPSAENRADALTRVPKKWLTPQGASMVCGAVVTEPDIARIHHTSGHPGITRTLRLCRRQSSDVTRAQVRAVIRQCQACQSVDPAPQRWVRGTLGVNECWERVSMDVCHADNQLYLTLVDCIGTERCENASNFADWFPPLTQRSVDLYWPPNRFEIGDWCCGSGSRPGGA
ncbi:uncharacterized protein LOC122365419 [Amphibalanus amphitrite]|uniref:uncharacterized protein LOC122365419 n=1 Tax=Amphibalanus amphitrite TaxID=1232801 RepID=UPI001C9079D1|nr:uncharacterized protein LOC122365419 [Amphibalanus amphitrite]